MRRCGAGAITRPITAREAWELIASRAYGLDSEARLVAVASGEDIDSAGRSSKWQFEFVLPVEIGRVRYEFAPGDENDQTLLLHEQVRPFGTVRRRASDPQGLRESWHIILGTLRPLPVPFRDSSEAVREIAAQGVSFEAGDIHLTLSGKVLPAGDVVWQVVSYGNTYTTPFALNC